MESEKVKEIKKTLGYCSTPLWTKCYNCSRAGEDSLCMYRLQADALTLINELERENERLANLLETERIVAKQRSTKLEKAEHDRDRYKKRIAELEEQRDRQAYITEELIQEKHRWTEQARKETAIEILNDLYHREELGFETIKWYAKEYWGIEIKE